MVATLIVLAAIAGMIFTQVEARRQFAVVTRLDEASAARLVVGHFGLLWTPVSGPGHLNFQPKLRRHPPTVSIDIVPDPHRGGCAVQVWTSNWTSLLGVMNHAVLAWRKKRSVVALFGASASSSSGPRPAVVAAVVGALVLIGGAALFALRTPTASSATPAGGEGAVVVTGAPATTEPTTAHVSSSGLVQTDAGTAAQPSAQTVLALLDRHFTAINRRDYAGWSFTVVTRRAQQQSAASWRNAYSSTTDSSVVVTSLTPSGSDSAVVGITFVSTQDLTQAPADLPATQVCWTSQWPVVDLSAGGRIDTPPPGTTSKQTC